MNLFAKSWITIFSCIIFLIVSTSIDAKDLAKIQENEWVIGDKNAPITMIEYASLSCPHCASFHKHKLPIIIEEYINTGKVKLVFRDFPLNLPALQASMVARCVGEELHFKYLEAFFNLQRSWAKPDESKELLFKIVENGGMTRDEFETCLADKDLENLILTDQLEAHKKLKISTTPSLIINGVIVEGNEPLETFRSIFDKILSLQ